PLSDLRQQLERRSLRLRGGDDRPAHGSAPAVPEEDLRVGSLLSAPRPNPARLTPCRIRSDATPGPGGTSAAPTTPWRSRESRSAPIARSASSPTASARTAATTRAARSWSPPRSERRPGGSAEVG